MKQEDAQGSVAEGVAGPPPSLVRALRRLLQPLVRLLLSHQVTYPFLSNLLKSVYLEVAERELAVPGQRQTISRLSLLTGLHRKDVKRLQGEAREPQVAPPVVSLGAQLVARWTGMPEFLDPGGRPRPLARQGSAAHAAGETAFEQLVESVSKDIRPRSVLDEWLRLGVVELDAEERVRLRVEAFVPERGFEEKAFYFGRNLHDHIAAGAHNLAGEGAPMLERSVYYDELSPDSVRELSELSERRGMEALQAILRRAIALQKRDAGRPDARERVNFGVYLYRGPGAGAGDAEPGESR